MIPVTLVTGFLGAGKTSFLSHILAAPDATSPCATSRPNRAVIINEFAGLGLDALQLPRGDYAVWELTKGSIFCVCMQQDFIDLLHRLAHNVRPDEIWIEPTGIADIRECEKILALPSLRSSLFLQRIVCLVDPTTITKILPTLHAAHVQIQCADVLIINKCDSVDETTLDAVEERLRTLAPDTPCVRTRYGAVDLAQLPTRTTHTTHTTPPQAHEPQAVDAIAITEDCVVDPEALCRELRALAPALWRVKGQCDTPHGLYWIEGTSAHLTVQPCATPASSLPARTSFVCIGPALTEDAVRRALQKALYTGNTP